MPYINHNIPSMITGAALNKVSGELQNTLERLSTGLRINRASDDAAGLSVSESLRTQIRGNHMASRNTNDGKALLNIAEGAMNEIHDMLQRMRELTIQAANDTYTSTERLYMNVEFEELKTEITRTAEATKYNGVTLLDGTAFVGATLHVGANFTGADVINVTIPDIRATALNLGASVVTDYATASSALSAVDAAIQTVSTERSDIGAKINRLEHTYSNLKNQEANMQAAESLIRDADFAEETSKFSREQILQQSSTSMLAQANMVPQSVLSLLQ